MAIRVIKHGIKRVVECQKCTCLFEFEKEDVSSDKVGITEIDRYVSCPDCRQHITVKDLF